MSSEKDRTILAHNARPDEGPVNRPVQRGSTVVFRSMAAFKAEIRRTDFRDSNRYGRVGNINAHDFEKIMCALEGGYGAITASSGLAVITTTMLAFAKSGDHILLPDSVYSPVRYFADQNLKSFGVAVEYYDPLIGADIEKAIRPSTSIIYLESPGSKTFEVQDVPAITAIAKRHNIITMLDNTWATPLFFKPLSHGVDISLHAATKYLGGHSDLFLGVAVCAAQAHYEILKECAIHLGQCAAPDDLVLALRSLRTLDVRMQRHQENTRVVLDWLRDRPEVERILYPAEPGNPGYDFWKRDFTGATGLFSMALKPANDEATTRFIEGLEYFPIGYSWGGYESLIVPLGFKDDRTVRPFVTGGSVLRLHIGLENPSDLIADLVAGFARMKG